jgi:Nif-specific regulatory protein
VDTQRLEAERNLYLRLLDLGHQSDVASFLTEALGLIARSSGVHHGYIELYDDEEGTETPRWWTAYGFSADEIENVRQVISRGIIAQAIATGEAIVTDCAWLDPRFSERESVQSGRIEVVLCAPIGTDPPLGVLYLQGGEGETLFPEERRQRVTTAARHLAPLLERLLISQRALTQTDPTRPYRQKLRLDSIIGSSPGLAAVLRDVDLVARIDVTVLLSGDTGVGKTELARVIHANGPRSVHPFVELSCANFPDTLIESELFGAAAGAHSTATRRIVGKVEAAEKGTLFLDEVGELSPPAQAKLLQLLESRTYYPLGSAEPVRADVRVIAATNADLRRAVDQKQFREDLYHRLQGFPIRVPTLAERRQDIAPLASFLLRRFCESNRIPCPELSRSAIRALESAEWPGNVRDLARTVQNGVIRAVGGGGKQVERWHLFPDGADSSGVAHESLSFQEATRQFQAQLVLETLEQAGWNVADAARRLDLARSHVYNLIHAFGLERQTP